MHVDLFFDHYFNFLSVKTNWHNEKDIKLINPGGSKVFKTQIPATRSGMWLSDFELDVVWTAFQLLLKLHSHISVLWPFCKIPLTSGFSFLGIGLKTRIRKSRKIFIFGFIILANIHVDLLFDHYFYCFSVKTDINKNEVNSVYPEGSKAFKTHIPATWLAIWVMHFQARIQHFKVCQRG